MNVPVSRVPYAGLDQDCIGNARIELPLEVTRYPPAEKCRGIAKHDRSSIERADDCARSCRCRINHNRRNRVSELAWLAAGLDVAPACRRRHDRHADSLDDLAGLQRGFERPGDKFLDGKIANTRNAAQ